MPAFLRRGASVLLGTTLAATALFTLSPAPLAHAEEPAPVVTVDAAVHHDSSPDARSIVRPATSSTSHDKKAQASDPDEDEGEEEMPSPPAAPNPDPVTQKTAPGKGAPNTLNSFDGIGDGFKGFVPDGTPADPNSAVSPNQLVETVNSAFAVFDKSGNVLLGPSDINSLFTGFGGPCESTNDGDPVVRWDNMAQRWIITQFANVRTDAGPYYECIAVSKTADATGAYNRYAYQFSAFPDYPKLSVWPDAYYITFNMFPQGLFIGARACAFDRAKMLAGEAATMQCFNTARTYGGLQGGDLDGSTPPPAGMPQTFLSMSTLNQALAYWQMRVDFANSANTKVTGPSTLPIASFSPACVGVTGKTCIPQKGATTKLDALSDRLMFRLAYRNFGDHQAWVVTHSVRPDGPAVSGVRWYELRPNASGQPSVYQQGTFAPSDGVSRWVGSAAMDGKGDIGIGYSASSDSMFPSIKYTGRTPSDPLGQMTQTEGTIVDGTGFETPKTRWGDYASLSVDPSDDCTFWYTGMYMGTSPTKWRTRIGSFKIGNCSSTTPVETVTVSNPGNQSNKVGDQVNLPIAAADNQGKQLTYSATGLPAGLSINATTGVITGSPTTAGTYAVTVTATSSTGVSGTTSFTWVIGGGGQTETVTVTNPGNQTNNVGDQVNLPVSASDSAAKPLTYSASGLPAGLTINPTTGVITGSPASAGTFTVTVTATSSTGVSGTTSFTWTVTGGSTNETVTVKNPGDQTNKVGDSIYVQTGATDNLGTSLTYSATGLPPGISISSYTGSLMGSPTTPGTYKVTVTATSSTGVKGTASFTWTITGTGGGGNCTGNVLKNGGFESGPVAWTTSGSNVIGNFSGDGAPRSGTASAWFDGYGYNHTDSISQAITIPTGCKATLDFYLKITTAETSIYTAYDTLVLTVNGSRLGSYSNLDAAGAYRHYTIDLSAYAGQTVTLKFTGTEDSASQTSFILDDVAANLS